MFSTALLLVLSSGFLHSVWNLYTKRSMNKHVFLWFCQIVAILAFLPWAVRDWGSTTLTSIGILMILASMLLHGLYMMLLAATYTIGDLSQVYPIMRGTSPLLVPLIAVSVLGEQLSIAGWLGISLIVLGIVLLSNITFRRKASNVVSVSVNKKAPLLALAVGVCIACYIVVDKIALDYVSAVVLNEAGNISTLLVLSWATIRSGGIQRELKANWKVMLLGGLIAPGGYLLFLLALDYAPVAQLAPMREIGTVFGSLMGVFILREKQGTRRLFTSILITAGIIILGVWG
ncbi:DMT family transporter [Paenibacillus agricola]|uniref:EamA family transporter n=1 Tax=Paenibacillus agricola TaxID=2716264 RepID=A0ABX0J661_9BACL|nr:DMT family transporter [Paenibacillus agricola]NHN31829.1 EamA family transporter [Paenibacillus agricola]